MFGDRRQDEARDFFRVTGKAGVAGIQRENGLGVHSLRHYLLELGVDHSVVVRDLIPGGLVPPCGLRDVVAKGGNHRGFLRDSHDEALLLAEVLTERLLELVRLDPEVTIAVGKDVGCSLRRVFTAERCR